MNGFGIFARQIGTTSIDETTESALMPFLLKQVLSHAQTTGNSLGLIMNTDRIQGYNYVISVDAPETTKYLS